MGCLKLTYQEKTEAPNWQVWTGGSGAKEVKEVIVQTINAIRETRRNGESSFDLNNYFTNLNGKVPSSKQTHSAASSTQSLYFTGNIKVGNQTIPVTFNLVLDFKNSFGGHVIYI